MKNVHFLLSLKFGTVGSCANTGTFSGNFIWAASASDFPQVVCVHFRDPVPGQERVAKGFRFDHTGIAAFGSLVDSASSAGKWSRLRRPKAFSRVRQRGQLKGPVNTMAAECTMDRTQLYTTCVQKGKFTLNLFVESVQKAMHNLTSVPRFKGTETPLFRQIDALPQINVLLVVPCSCQLGVHMSEGRKATGPASCSSSMHHSTSCQR